MKLKELRELISQCDDLSKPLKLYLEEKFDTVELLKKVEHSKKETKRILAMLESEHIQVIL